MPSPSNRTDTSAPVTGDRASACLPPLATPDGRYIIVNERLWRASNPNLSADERHRLVGDLMTARRAVRMARRAGDTSAETAVHAAVNAAKVALGERGAPWWKDGAPDLNRRLVKNTPYASWYDDKRGIRRFQTRDKRTLTINLSE